MLSKKILTVATIASVLTLGAIGSAHAESAAAPKDATKTDPKAIPAERIKPIFPECLRSRLGCNPTFPDRTDANLKRSKAIIATYSPEQKEKLLNTLVNIKVDIKDIKSFDSLAEKLGDRRLAVSLRQEAGFENPQPSAKINWIKVIRLVAQLILALTE